MNNRKSKSEIKKKPESIRILALAGEYHQLLTGGRYWAAAQPEVPKDWGLLPKTAAKALKASSLVEYLGLDPESVTPASWPPESLPRLLESLDREWVRGQGQKEKLVKEAGQIEVRRKKIAKRRQAETSRLDSVEFRLDELQETYQDLEEKVLGQEAEHQPGLSRLAKKLRKNIEYLKRSGLDKSDPAVARRQSEYISLKAKLDSGRAVLSRGRSELEARAAQLERLSLQAERHRTAIEHLDDSEESFVNRLEEIKTGQVHWAERLEAVGRAREDLVRAGKLWKELQTELEAWPRAASGLKAQTREVVDFDWSKEYKAFENIETRLVDALQAGAAGTGVLKEGLLKASDLVGTGQDFEARVMALSLELDRKTADLEGMPQDPAGELRESSRQVQQLQRERAVLLSRRDKLSSGLSGSLKKWEEIELLRQKLAKRRDSLVRQGVARVRSQAVKRGAMARRVHQARQRLAELYSGLVPLVGPSARLEELLLAGALKLVESREFLEAGKKKLAGAHDRFNNVDRDFEGTFEAGLSELVRAEVQRLQGLTAGGEMAVRLPRQLESRRCALVRAEKVRRLKEAYHRRSGELTRVGGERDGFKARLDQSRQQLSSLLEEKDRLVKDLAGIRLEANDASGDKERLVGELASALDQAREGRNAIRDLKGRLKLIQGKAVGLAAAKERLSKELGTVKAENSDLSAERDGLSQELEMTQGELAGLSEERDRLAGGLETAQTRADELSRERQRLVARLKATVVQTNALVEEKTRLADDLGSTRARVTDLVRERDRLGKDLKTVREQAETFGREKQELQAGLEQTSKKAAALTGAVGRLKKDLGASREEARVLTEEKERLSGDLNAARRQVSGLTTHLEEEVYPLVKTLGLALHLGQVRIADLSRKEKAQEKDLAALTALVADLETGKKRSEATAIDLSKALVALGEENDRLERAFEQERIKLKAAIKEASERAEFLSGRLKELDAEHRVQIATHKKETADLNVKIVQLESSRREAEENSGRLGKALADLGQEFDQAKEEYQKERKRLVKLARGWADRAGALTARLEEVEARNLDALNLIQRQAREIQDERDNLAELYPLLEFFMDRLEVWVGPPAQEEPPRELPAGSEYWVLLVHLLRQENEMLKDQVVCLDDHRRSLTIENDHLARSHSAIKERLEELLPVFAYFWKAWLGAATALAESNSRELMLTRSLNAFKRDHTLKSRKIEKLTSELMRTVQDLNQTRADLKENRTVRFEVETLYNRFKELYEQSSKEAEALRAIRKRLLKATSAQRREIEGLSQDRLLLTHDKKRLETSLRFQRAEADEREEEVEHLTIRLSDQTGAAASAWAALNQLAERSQASITALQRELTAQAETIRALEDHSLERAAQTAELEKAQDRMALLFWLLTKYGGSNDEVFQTLIKQSQGKGFRDAAEITGARVQELAIGAAARVKSRRFQQMARQSVRRGLYSILLAGGLVFSLPQEPSKAVALPGSRTNAPGPVVEMVKDESRLKANLPLEPVYCEYVGRPFDISFIPVEEKEKGLRPYPGLDIPGNGPYGRGHGPRDR